MNPSWLPMTEACLVRCHQHQSTGTIPEIMLSLCYLGYTHGLSQDDPVMGIECIGLFLFHDRENIPGIATGTTSGCFNTGLPKIQLILRCSIPGDLGICTPGIDLLTYS